MRLIVRCFNLLFALFALLPCHSTYSTAQEDAIYNGFKQFLGKIYYYQSDQLRGGLSQNKQYVYSVNDNTYVVRILKEPLSMRQGEVKAHLVAADHTLAPTIHYYDEHEYSFVIMDFIEGQTLPFEHANRRDVLDLVVDKVRSIAQFDVSTRVSAMDLRARMVHYYKKIREYADPLLDFMLQSALCVFELVCQNIEKEYRPLLFGHNDLHPRNIFYMQDDMMIIDWELAGLNYPLYDLANYAVYACLNEVDEYYLLTRYLQRFPSDNDLDYFKKVKLVVKVFNAFGFLICLNAIPDGCDNDSVKEFDYYARIFAEDTNANDPEFLYEIALSLLREFFEEYEQIEHGK